MSAARAVEIDMETQITPLLITYNEESNLRRTLERLRWAKRIVIVDSFSTDETLQIAREWPQVEIFQRPFDSFAEQCNYGLTQIHTPWVLSLDADYVLSNELIAELKGLSPGESIRAFSAKFQYWVMGRPLRASLYPPRVVLYRKDDARYENDGHGHKVTAWGQTSSLRGVIYHDDRKPLCRWLSSQDRYAKLEAEKLVQKKKRYLAFSDRLRKSIVLGAPAVFVYTLLVCGLVLDGWPGWYYSFQRVLAEVLLSLRLIEKKFDSGFNESAAPLSKESHHTLGIGRPTRISV